MDRNNGGGAEHVGHLDVALRKESVDRNRNALPVWAKVASRSPQGERG